MAEKLNTPQAGSADPPPVPDDLGPAGRKLWTAVVAELDLDAHERAILRAAGQVADTINSLERHLPAAGLVVTGARGGLMLHPAVGELRLQRQALGRLLGQLKVPPAEADNDQPGRRDVPTRSQQARQAALARWHGSDLGAG